MEHFAYSKLNMCNIVKDSLAVGKCIFFDEYKKRCLMSIFA